MSRDREIVAGLDLGSTKTCAVIAEVVGELPRLPLAKVLGVGLAKNAGVRRGMVRDIDETSRSIVAAMRDAERMAGVKVSAVTCGIAGEHVSARTSPGVVAVSGDEITAEDVARVNEVARAVSLGRDHELLHDIPQEYVVDQQRGISDPVGMTGTRLEVEMYLVTVQSTAAQNLRRSVERARYRPAELVLEPLVDASEMINLPATPSQGARQASRELLSHIIHQRMDEIFQLVQREFERAGYGGGRLPAGVVLTGGTAHLPGTVELAREAFALPVRAGTPEQGISGLVDSVQAPRYAVPVGLVLYAARRLAQGGVPSGSMVKSAGVERWFGPLKRWLQDFF